MIPSVRSTRAGLVLGLVFVGLVPLACTGKQQPGTLRKCPGGVEIVTMNCDGTIQYNGNAMKAEAAIKNIFSATASSTPEAVRDVSEGMQSYQETYRQLCEQHNACKLMGDEFTEQSREARLSLVDLATGEQKAQLAEVFQEQQPKTAGGKLQGYPQQTLSFRMVAQLPDGSQRIVRPNEPLPVGASAWFEVSLESEGYLYMFQKTQAAGVTALFPHAKIGIPNPLQAGRTYRIPPEPASFGIDDQDLGTENVYIFVSAEPNQEFDQEIKKMAAADSSKMSDYENVGSLDEMAPGGNDPSCRTRALNYQSGQERAKPGCKRSRGLVLQGGSDNAEPNRQPKNSMQVQNDPGDDVIVKVFPWQHVSAEEYAAKKAAYDDPGESGKAARGSLSE